MAIERVASADAIVKDMANSYLRTLSNKLGIFVCTMIFVPLIGKTSKIEADKVFLI